MSKIEAELNLKTSGFAAAAAAVDKNLSSIGRRALWLNNSLLSVAGGFVALAGVAAPALAAIAKAAEMQTLKTSFGVLTGSANEAQKMLEKLASFAASTPFEMPELASAARQLLAFGFSSADVVKTLQSLGDVASGSGQPIGELAYLLGTAKVQGRLFQQDINQFTGRGIPIVTELAKVFGVAESEIRKMTEAGEIGFPEVMQAFKNMTGEGGKFTGMMQAQSATWNGLLSTLSDNIGAAMRAFGEPVIDALSPALKSMTENASKLAGAAGVLGNMTVGAVNGLGMIAQVGTTLAPVLAALAAKSLGVEAAVARMSARLAAGSAMAFVAAFNRMGEAVGNAAVAMARGGSAAMGFRVALGTLAAGGGTAFAALGTAARAAGSAIMSAFGPVGWIIMGITAAVQALIGRMTEAQAKAEAINSIQNEKADVILDFGKRSQSLQSEDDRQQLLKDIEKQKQALTSRMAAGAGTITKDQEQEYSKYATDLQKAAEWAKGAKLNPGTTAAPVTPEDAAKEAAKEADARKKTREDATGNLATWRDDQELESAETPEEKRAILMKRSGFKSTEEMDARISKLGKLLSLGNASTTEAEAAELGRLTSLRGQVGGIDRDTAKQKTSEEQVGVNDLGKKASELMDTSKLPQMQVWADSARKVGLGGSAATNQSEIAKLAAERQREANSILREIRDALKKNPKLESPELVFG